MDESGGAGAGVCSLCGRPVGETSFDHEGKPPTESRKTVLICDACQDRLRAEAARERAGH